MLAGPRVNLWRAVIDNDMWGWNGSKVIAAWRNLGLDALSEEPVHMGALLVERSGEGGERWKEAVVHVRNLLCSPAGFRMDVDYTYTVLPDGRVCLHLHCIPDREAPPVDVPRVGLRMRLPGGFERVKWYGRGPGESYPDSTAAAFLGIHDLAVDDLYTPYVRPQENGSRGDVRWLFLRREDGGGLLLFSPGGVFSFAAHRFSQESLDAARHTVDLDRSDDVHLYVDLARRGLGSASCGPPLDERYRVILGEIRFDLCLVPLERDEVPPRLVGWE